MKPIIEKSAIYNICLNHINTVNSFVDDDGNNSFETMVREIEEYVSHQRQEILDGLVHRAKIAVDTSPDANSREIWSGIHAWIDAERMTLCDR